MTSVCTPHEPLPASVPQGAGLEAMDFADGVLGAGLPPEVEALIAQAGRLPADPAQAEALLQQARRLAPTHPAPLIALYRFHFYGHRLQAAREVAHAALDVARAALGPGFGVSPPSEAEVRFDPSVRFYLFTLKGQAYLSLRLGDTAAATGALGELQRLDPQDRMGGAVLATVLARAALDPDDEALALPVPARGWAEPPGSSS